MAASHAAPECTEKHSTVVVASADYAYDQQNDFVARDNAALYTPVQVLPNNSDIAIRFHNERMARTIAVQDYLGWSIFSVICCCFPLNVIGLIHSIITREAKRYGDPDRAQKSSVKAKSWLVASTVIGIIFIAAYGALQFYFYRCTVEQKGIPNQ